MIATRISTFCLAVLASVALAGETAVAQGMVASRETTPTVVGEWKGESLAGGVGTRLLLNLYNNGTYSQRSTMVSEYGWTLDGETLLMAPIVTRGADPTYGKAMSLKVKLVGDSMIASADRQQIVLRRQTSRVDHSPILGRWEGLSDLNEPITQDFTVDGRLIITVVMTREAGRYTVDKHQITWAEQIPVPRRHRTRYRLEGDALTLISSPRLPALELVRVLPDSQN